MECFWIYLDEFECTWIYWKECESIEIYFNVMEQIWMYLNVVKFIRMCWYVFKFIWLYLFSIYVGSSPNLKQSGFNCEHNELVKYLISNYT